MIDGTTMKGKTIIIPLLLLKQILQQLPSNHMGIQKMRLLACESVKLTNMYTDMKNTIKQCATCMDYQQSQPYEKIILYKMPQKPLEVVGVDIFPIKNNTLLCIVDYHSNFLS